MNKFLIASAIVLSQVVSAQEITYFDEEWKVIKDKKNAAFYRETSKKGEYYYIKDFYINGVLQMEGMAISTKPNAEVFQGKVVWYYPNGKVNMLSNYKNGIQVGEYKYYNEKGQITQDFIYKEDGEIQSGKSYVYKDEYSAYNVVSDYANGNLNKSVVYDNSITDIRYEESYNDGYNVVEGKYYDKGGKLLGIYKADKTDPYIGTGVKVDYYYNPMQVSCIITYKKGVTNYNDAKCYYDNGKLKKETINKGKTAIEIVYDENGKKLGTMEYRYAKEYETLVPFEGTSIGIDLYQRGKKIDYIFQYKNGKQIDSKINDEHGNLQQHIIYGESGDTKEIISYKDGKQTGKLIYKDGQPFDGELYNEYRETHYKDGKITLDRKRDLEGNITYEKILNRDKKQYEVKTFYLGKQRFFYTIKDTNDSDYVGGFMGEVVPYNKKGKPESKVIIKNGIVEKGKLRIPSYGDTIEEYYPKGKWFIKRIYNKEKELIKEEKYKKGTEIPPMIYEDSFTEWINYYEEVVPISADED